MYLSPWRRLSSLSSGCVDAAAPDRTTRPAQIEGAEHWTNEGGSFATEVTDERGGVIEQAFALDGAGHAPRDAEAPHDRRCGQRVDRRDDRTEDEGGCPRQARDQRVRDPGDG